MKNIIMLFFCIAMITGVAYAGTDPQTYYEIEIKARELTIEGMQKRLVCMNNSCPLSDQFAIDEEYQQKVMLMHEEYSTTASSLAAWYTNHRQETDNYFLTNPRLQLRLDELTAFFESLSDAINNLLEARQ